MVLLTRVISALAGAALLAAVTWLGGPQGLAILCGLVSFAALNEYRKLAFAKIQAPLSFQIVFLVCSTLSFFVLLNGNYVFEVLGLVTVLSLFLALGLWTTRKNVSVEVILQCYGLGLIGIIYCSVFPVLILKTVYLSKGLIWFYSLALIVFSGDTLAYVGGRLVGKTKLYPLISPKKTVEGAISGAAGSALFGGAYFYYFLPGIPIYVSVPFCLICGLIAQSGDLFVSLIKRVADVKDTGKLMPGHGGVLDRLDGIYISAPLVYTFSVICLFLFDL